MHYYLACLHFNFQSQIENVNQSKPYISIYILSNNNKYINLHTFATAIVIGILNANSSQTYGMVW